MTRINIGDGQWFNPQAARRWQEDTRWNGSNHVSVATGSQWEHEELYRTKSGNWILHSWSQWQGSTPRYELISPDAAREWLTNNDHDAEEFFPGALAEAEV